MTGFLRRTPVWSALAGHSGLLRAIHDLHCGPRLVLKPCRGPLNLGYDHPRHASFSTGTASLDLNTEKPDWSAGTQRWIPRPDDPVGHPTRTLVLCFDGTGDQFDHDNSNVVKFAAALKKDNPHHQMVYYQPGIGTSTDYSSLLRKVAKYLDLMFAWSLPKRVREGYEFLMQNYSEGDKIAIFGYSRGAYTARALARMLQKVGLLPPYNKQLLPFAYQMYSRTDAKADELAAEFKTSFSSDVIIDFVGVWDTVRSVGLVSRPLPFVNSNHNIRTFRQALALDERRTKFRANHYRQWGKVLEDSSTTNESGSDIDSKWETDFLEVWFAGAHADIGGGSVANKTRHSLSRIPLRWMIRECFRCNTGIIFNLKVLQDYGIDIDTVNERVKDPYERFRSEESPKTDPESWLSRRITPLSQSQISTQPLAKPHESSEGEGTEDELDVLDQLYDKLEIDPAWWLLEWIPLPRQKGYAMSSSPQSRTEYGWVINRGQGRKVPHAVVERGIKVHKSVRTRLERGEEYVPQMRPNIMLDANSPHARLVCRRMTHKEWISRRVDGAEQTKPWFEWVS